MKPIYTLGGALALSILTACGGGGGGTSVTTYSGNTSQATLSSSNASAFTKVTPDANSQELASSEIPFANAFAGKTSSKLMETLVKSGGYMQQAPVAGICTTGSVDATGNQSSATITFSNCTLDSSIYLNARITLNGTISASLVNYPTSFSMDITNFTVTFTDFNTTRTETIENMSLSCSNSSCIITSDFTGADGKVYRIANYTVSGVYPSYSINGRIYHPDHGYVDITGDIGVETCGTVEKPTSGSIVLTGANSTAIITFVDCSTFSVNFNSSTTTTNW